MSDEKNDQQAPPPLIAPPESDSTRALPVQDGDGPLFVEPYGETDPAVRDDDTSADGSASTTAGPVQYDSAADAPSASSSGFADETPIDYGSAATDADRDTGGAASDDTPDADGASRSTASYEAPVAAAAAAPAAFTPAPVPVVTTPQPPSYSPAPSAQAAPAASPYVVRTDPEPTPQTQQAQPQRVFVTPPVEPKKKGNRGIGSLIALLAVIPFAVLYAGVAAVIIAFQSTGSEFTSFFTVFVTSPVFIVPAVFFIVGFVIVVLLVNRANWWAYVLGSLLVALFVYFGTIGARLVTDDVVGMTPSEASARFADYAINPFVIASAIVAREVAIWIGSAIAARGRRVKAKNLTSRQDYERQKAEHQAEFERNYAPAS